MKQKDCIVVLRPIFLKPDGSFTSLIPILSAAFRFACVLIRFQSFTASVSTQAGRKPLRRAMFCEWMFAAAVP